MLTHCGQSILGNSVNHRETVAAEDIVPLSNQAAAKDHAETINSDGRVRSQPVLAH